MFIVWDIRLKSSFLPGLIFEIAIQYHSFACRHGFPDVNNIDDSTYNWVFCEPLVRRNYACVHYFFFSLFFSFGW